MKFTYQKERERNPSYHDINYGTHNSFYFEKFKSRKEYSWKFSALSHLGGRELEVRFVFHISPVSYIGNFLTR